MKTMRMLYDQAMEELDGVIEYSTCSMKYKELDYDLSKMYSSMAKAEMEHAKSLHNVSQRLASEKMGDKDSIDPRLMELWEEMESAKLDKMAKAQSYLTLACA